MPSLRRSTIRTAGSAVIRRPCLRVHTMTTPVPLVGYIASLRNEIRRVRIAHTETSRSYIGSQLHDILALVEPADAIELAIGSLCEHCFNLLEVLKQCDVPGTS